MRVTCGLQRNKNYPPYRSQSLIMVVRARGSSRGNTNAQMHWPHDGEIKLEVRKLFWFMPEGISSHCAMLVNCMGAVFFPVLTK